MENDTKHKKNYRKGSIILVLLVSSSALIVVLALTALCSLNINIMRSQLEYTQSLLIAQSSVSQFLYELDYDKVQNNHIDITSQSGSCEFKTKYDSFAWHLNMHSELPVDVFITFDQTKNYYSTDNSFSESPARGWKDNGINTASVPPFSIDLIFNTKIGGSIRHFEALIGRTWKYAAYCERAGISITTPKEIIASTDRIIPSFVKGNLISSSTIHLGVPSSIDQDNVVIGNLCTACKKPDINDQSFNDPLFVNPGNYFKGKKEYNINSLFNGMYPLFRTMKFPNKAEFKELDLCSLPQLQIVGFGAESELSLEEDSFIWASSDNRLEKFKKALSNYVEIAQNNIDNLPDDAKLFIVEYVKNHKVTSAQESQKEIILKAVKSFVYKKYCGYSLFLKNNLEIIGNSECNKFYLKGNLTNHYLKYKRIDYSENVDQNTIQLSNMGTWECRDEIFSRAGLILRNCTFYLDGDLELIEYNPNLEQNLNEGISGISLDGTNATLIVSGNLKIMGGGLDSKDKGMVLLANNIEFSTKGNFKGIILSKGLILINPDVKNDSTNEENKLNIHGAIACGGVYVEGEEKLNIPIPSNKGLILKGINLIYEPRYTKALHQFGIPKVILWQELE